MPTQFQEIFRALAAPFDDRQVKKLPKGGRQLSYVTARTVMNRLDDVLGPENWWDEYISGTTAVACRLSIRLPDGTILTKSDCGGGAGMSDEGDDEKSAFSDAFKRAAVKFGVGRHLYGDGIPSFAAGARPGRPFEPEPRRDEPAPPETSPRPTRAPDTKPENTPDFDALPRAGTGGAFWWFKNLGDHYGLNLARKAEDLAQADGLPKSFKDWPQDALDRIAVRAIAYCRKLPQYKGELEGLAAAHGLAAGRAADPEAVQGKRSALYLKASMLFARLSPGQGSNEQAISSLICDVSGDEIQDIMSCEDIPAMERALAAIQKAIDERDRR